MTLMAGLVCFVAALFVFARATNRIELMELSKSECECKRFTFKLSSVFFPYAFAPSQLLLYFDHFRSHSHFIFTRIHLNTSFCYYSVVVVVVCCSWWRLDDITFPFLRYYSVLDRTSITSIHVQKRNSVINNGNGTTIATLSWATKNVVRTCMIGTRSVLNIEAWAYLHCRRIIEGKRASEFTVSGN